MSTVKMQRSEVVIFADKLNDGLKTDEKLSFDIVYALNKTKHKIKSQVDEINDILNDTQKQSRMLALEYCEKDDDGKPLIKNGRYAGLDTGLHPEYDAKIEELNKKSREYLREEIDIEIHSIKREAIPQKGPAILLETLCYLIDE